MVAQIKNEWVLGAFYTENTPYEKVIKDYLLPTTESLGIRTIVKSIPSHGDWHRNVAEKPKIILDILNELPPEQCLVFVDADACVLKYPELFDRIPQEYDLACHYLSWNVHYGHVHYPDILECLSGTLFFRNNVTVKSLCIDWHSRAIQSNQWEQKILGECLKTSDIKVYELPYEYITIPTLPDGRSHPRGSKDAVITHGQVSRTFKRKLVCGTGD